MVINKIESLFQKRKESIREKGLFLFLRHLFFHYVICYIYENTLNGPSFPCRINNTQSKIVSSVEEFDYLLKKGFDFTSFSLKNQQYKIRLRNGAVLFCLCVNGEVAHTSWLGLDKEAFHDFYPFPPEDDSAGYIGGTVTAPKYRRKGINLYIHSEMFRYLKRKGVPKALFSIRKENIAARNSQMKLDSFIKEERHELRFLLFFSFKWVRVRIA